MKLKNKEITPLLRAHLALEPSVVSKDLGTVRLKIAHNVDVLKKHETVSNEARRAAFKDISGDTGKIDKEETDKQVMLQEAMDQIDNVEVDIKLWSLDYSDMDIEKLQPGTISTLRDILVGKPDLGDPDL